MEEVLADQLINTKIFNQFNVIELYKFIGTLVMKYGDGILPIFTTEWATSQFRRLYPGMPVPADLTYLDLDVDGLVTVESNEWYYNLKFQSPIVKAVVHSSYTWILTLDGDLYRIDSKGYQELKDTRVVNLLGYSRSQLGQYDIIVYMTEDDVTNFLFYQNDKKYGEYSMTLDYKITSIGNSIFCTDQGEVYHFSNILHFATNSDQPSSASLEIVKVLLAPVIKEIHGNVLVSQDGRFFTVTVFNPNRVQEYRASGGVVDFTKDEIMTEYKRTTRGLYTGITYARYIGTELSANGKTIYATDDIHSINDVMIVRKTKTVLLVSKREINVYNIGNNDGNNDRIIVTDVTNTYPLVLSDDQQIYYHPLNHDITTSITNQMTENNIQVYLALLFPRLAYLGNRQMLDINASGWSPQTLQWLESPVEFSDQDTVTIQSWLDNTMLFTGEYKVNDLRKVAQWLLLLRNNYPGEGIFDRVELYGPVVKIIYRTV